MAQELHFRLGELALAAFGKEFVFLKPHQCVSEVICVRSLFFCCVPKYHLDRLPQTPPFRPCTRNSAIVETPQSPNVNTFH
jgi:hypothetical protein